jgi:hypothetical protein
MFAIIVWLAFIMLVLAFSPFAIDANTRSSASATVSAALGETLPRLELLYLAAARLFSCDL